jgi:formate hydrogenlyase subunit 4
MELLLGLALAPLLTGTIRRTKAFLAGRRGPPWLQGYLDLWKLLHKGAVYSRTTSFVFRAGPVLSLACVIGALALAPAGGLRPLAAFPGDFLLLVALLALARFALVLAALDTGSAFEGMGASREVAFAALAEPALLLCLASLAHTTGAGSLAEILARLAPGSWLGSGGVLALVGVALFGVLLVENSRMPFDDPTTHLELTMVHEVMVLDHGGPDLAAIEWGAMLKLWLFAGLLAGAVVPLPGVLAHGLGILGVGVAVGIVESTMARLRLLRVPQILVAITLLALLSVVLAPGRGA